jgi:hypothetical protein
VPVCVTMKSFGYSRVAVTVSGQSIVLIRYFSEVTTAVLGVVTPMYQCTTSIQWVRRSVSTPPPKSRKCRQRKKRSGFQGCSGAEPSQAFQSSFAWSTGGQAPMPIRWCQ